MRTLELIFVPEHDTVMEESPLKRFFTSKLAIKVYIVLASGFILLFLLDSFILPWIVHSREEIAIPSVTSMPYEEAESILKSSQLKPVRAATAPSSNVKAGHVLYQNPAGGSIVREGRNVYLTVSGGEQQVLMPSLRGRSLRDAKITLERLELAVGMITYEASDLPNETIVSQGISSGKKLSPGTPIDLVVSLGKDMQQIDVPYIVGFTLNDAQRKLLESGLKLGNVGYQENPSLSPHTVISQSPSAGEKVDPNAPIDVILVR